MSENLEKIDALEKRIAVIEGQLQSIRDLTVASLEADIKRLHYSAIEDAAALNLIVGINRAIRGEKEE